ncbi:hypothetical protein Baya_5385 [Bagarius yarrelli]|uniref:Uncharacterized protein n=1 Tax=Bagarius yarrelli TaxID=175774 RepID=A0A556TWN3_BAGYA|nr:hypothetical protein Baya_5385 [Bagarius yarrelli]
MPLAQLADPWRKMAIGSEDKKFVPCKGEVVETFENGRDALCEQLCFFLCICCQGNKDRTCSNLSPDQQLEAFPGQAFPLLFLLSSVYECV